MTIVEVTVAAAILLVGVLGTLALIGTAQTATQATRAREGATSLARELVERTRNLSYTSLTRGVGDDATAGDARLPGSERRPGGLGDPPSRRVLHRRDQHLHLRRREGRTRRPQRRGVLRERDRRDRRRQPGRLPSPHGRRELGRRRRDALDPPADGPQQHRLGGRAADRHPDGPERRHPDQRTGHRRYERRLRAHALVAPPRPCRGWWTAPPRARPPGRRRTGRSPGTSPTSSMAPTSSRPRPRPRAARSATAAR